MKKLIKLMLIIGALATLSSEASLLGHIYSLVLGRQDLDKENTQVVESALKAYNINHKVLIKKMGSFPSSAVRIPLASFTMSGIWFDQDFLNSCTPEQKEWDVFHEAAHYKLNHHAKLLGMGALSLGAIALTVYTGCNMVDATPSIKLILAAALGLSTSWVAVKKVLQSYVRQQEQEADEYAAKTLQQIGKIDTVKKHIESLEKNSNTTDIDDIYHPSSKKQIAYIHKIIQQTDSQKS